MLPRNQGVVINQCPFLSISSNCMWFHVSEAGVIYVEGMSFSKVTEKSRIMV